MNPKPVVTRFAPSPTGYLHIGSIRTALYAWLFARKHQGTFILRIEDTDKEREVEGSIEHIIKSLTWLGVDWNEGPYLQSKRLDIYNRYAQTLIEKGYAYPDPYSQEEVEQFRTKAEEEKRPFLYRDYRPTEIGVWDGSRPLRFRVPEIKRYTWHDIVRGDLSAGEEALDDFILIKSDGYPTYNFAHIVDDIEMGVTHIVRGEEFISSTPRFLSLYEALGATPPLMASMPVILGPDGKKKLSKRDGSKDVLEYKNEGYIPEAVVNYLSLVGWHPEGNEEVLTIKALEEAFTLERIQSAGAKFDETKLRWFNHEHLKLLSTQEFTSRLHSFLSEQGKAIPPYLSEISSLLQERAETLADTAKQLSDGEYSFMEAAITYDPALLTQRANADNQLVRQHLLRVLSLVEEMPGDHFTEETVKQVVFPYATEQGRSAVLWPMRVALSGKEKSPDPFILASLLGKERTVTRITIATQSL